MNTFINILFALIAAPLIAAAGVSAAPAAIAERQEAAAIRSFCEGDYPRYADGLESLVSKHPLEPAAVIHYGDLFRLAEQTGADRIITIADRIRETIGRSGDARAGACRLRFTCEMERLLYRVDAVRGKKLTEELRPVRTWTLFGPYRMYGPGDLDRQFQPEVISAASEIHPQKRIRIMEADGWLDPGKYLFPATGVVYAKVSFRSKETVKIRIFSRSLYTVFVNGRTAARNTEDARRNMRMIVAGGNRGITVLVKLYGAPLEKMRMIITDAHDAVISPDMEPDASFSGDGDMAEELEYPYAALAAGRDDDARAEARLGLYFDDLRSAEAQDHYRKSLSIESDPFVSFRLAVSLKNAGTDRRPDTVSEGDGIISGLVKLMPAFAPARVQWLESLIEKEAYEDALGEAKKLAPTVLKNPFLYVRYLRLLNRMNYEKEFTECAAQAVARFPGSTEVMAEMADFYKTRDRGKYCDALRELVKRDFTPERVRFLAGEHSAGGDFGAALDLIKRYNFNNNFINEMVEINIRKGDFKAARSCILPALMVNDDPSLYAALGRMDILQNDDPSMYLQKALAIDPARHDCADYLRYCGRGAVENPFVPLMERKEAVDFSWYKKEYAAFPSAVLYRGRIFTLAKDGGSRVFCEDVIQVNDRQGGGRRRDIRVPFHGRIRPVRMRVYDGRGGYADSCTIRTSGEGTIISVNSPRGNSILHLSYIVDDPVTTLRGSLLFSLSPEYLQQYDEPVRRASIQVIAPAGMKVDFCFSKAVPVRTAMSEGLRLYSASIADIPPARRERDGGGMNGLNFYAFSTLQGFGDLAAWYCGLVREASGPVPRQALSFRKERIEETVAGVYDYIAREIETEGAALFYPAVAEATLTRKKGSVENKVLLAMVMLRGLGVKSYIAFARDRRLPDAGTCVSHDYFTAILLYVPLDIGHALWLDFSDRSLRCGATADGVTGANALVLLEKAYRFRKIQGGEAGSPVIEEEQTTIAPSGDD